VEAPLHALSLTAAVAAIAARRISARELADAQLARIEATDAAIEAWAALDPAAVRASADRSAEARGSLSGIGIGVKDIIATRALPTAMGSPVYVDHRPAADAAVVERLIDAGGYVFGKTVTTELAFMHPGKTRNPWNAAHTPGGSSSGSAAAVAAGHVCAALGTQTNGSIIRPAAYCGVVGFKPTVGTMPYDGVTVFSETLDTLGTFTRTVADAAWLASALADDDRLPAVIVPLVMPPRLGYLRAFPWAPLDGAAGTALDAAASTLQRHGAHVTPVALPEAWHHATVIHRSIMLCEGARNLGPLQRRERARLSSTLNAALDEGRTISDRDHRAALDARDRAIAALVQWLAPFDAIITPPAPAGAPAGLGATGDPSCCTLWSLTGFPALSIPIGLDPAGLPIGMQLAAPAGADSHMLSVAAWCEARLPFVGWMGSV
jgi:Asp-tRNA(Asn)/Glu-tRNA(Gln) amidotransferase A subunit family amidase